MSMAWLFSDPDPYGAPTAGVPTAGVSTASEVFVPGPVGMAFSEGPEKPATMALPLFSTLTAGYQSLPFDLRTTGALSEPLPITREELASQGKLFEGPTTRDSNLLSYDMGPVAYMPSPPSSFVASPILPPTMVSPRYPSTVPTYVAPPLRTLSTSVAPTFGSFGALPMTGALPTTGAFSNSYPVPMAPPLTGSMSIGVLPSGTFPAPSGYRLY
jgi:hypothetical protein